MITYFPEEKQLLLLFIFEHFVRHLFEGGFCRLYKRFRLQNGAQWAFKLSIKSDKKKKTETVSQLQFCCLFSKALNKQDFHVYLAAYVTSAIFVAQSLTFCKALNKT